MGLSIIIVEKSNGISNDPKLFYLGSFSGVCIALKHIPEEKIPIFSFLINCSDHENDLFVHDEQLVKFIDEVFYIKNLEGIKSNTLGRSLDFFPRHKRDRYQ